MTTLPPIDSLYWDTEYETMPRDRLRDLQFELLTETIAFAYEHSTLTREAWDAAKVRPTDITSWDDFTERVPFLDKDSQRRFRDDRHDPYGGVLCRNPAELTAINSTSGTTGDPTLVAEIWGGGYVGRPAIMYRDFWGMGVRPGDFFSLFLFTFRGPTYGFVQQLGAIPMLFDYDVGEIERLLHLSLVYRPTALYNFGGTMINATAEIAERAGIDPRDAFSSYKSVVFAGESLGVRARRLADDWGVELFEHSNVGDVTACFECPAHDGMHFWEDMAYVEGIDPHSIDHHDAQPIHADRVRCELIATALTNRVAPLVRFRSDDLVEIDRSPCACGRTHARVWTIGRKSDETVVRGVSVLPSDVWGAIEAVNACRLGLFQIVRPRREVDELRLRVGYQDTPTKRLDALADEVRGSVFSAVGIEPEVELTPNEALLRLGPPHKIPRVTSR
jgi:phenylacetate-CoA ligase